MKFAGKEEIRRHHNTKGLVRIKRGICRIQVIKMAGKLGLTYYNNEKGEAYEWRVEKPR